MLLFFVSLLNTRSMSASTKQLPQGEVSAGGSKVWHLLCKLAVFSAK